jgi:hypothetical protein
MAWQIRNPGPQRTNAPGADVPSPSLPTFHAGGGADRGKPGGEMEMTGGREKCAAGLPSGHEQLMIMGVRYGMLTVLGEATEGRSSTRDADGNR